jgi:hypothetical protein
MDVMNHHIDILCKNREIIHRQRDGPLIEFPEDPIYPPIPDPYASLAQTELATFGVGIPHAPTISNDDDKTMMMRRRPTMMRRWRMTSSCCRVFSPSGLFPFWCLDVKGREDSYLYI